MTNIPIALIVRCEGCGTLWRFGTIGLREEPGVPEHTCFLTRDHGDACKACRDYEGTRMNEVMIRWLAGIPGQDHQIVRETALTP